MTTRDQYPAPQPMMLDGEQAPPPNPIEIVFRALAGKWHWAILLGLILGIGGSYAGYNAMQPEFRSSGRIEIEQVRRARLYDTEVTDGIPAFESFVGGQVALLTSPRIRDAAATDPQLLEAGWPRPPVGVIRLQNRLEVGSPRRSPIIMVSVSDEDPRLAKAAVDAVLRAYERIAIDGAQAEFAQRDRELRNIRDSNQRERDSREERARLLAQEEGTDDLTRRLQQQDAMIERLGNTIFEMERSFASMGIPTDINAETGRIPATVLANMDDQLRTLKQQETELLSQRTQLSTDFGPRHRELRDLDRRIAGVRARMQERVEELQQEVPRIVGELDKLRRELQAAVEERRRLGQVQLRIAQLREEASRHHEIFEDARRRLEQLRVESQNRRIARISIEQEGDVPLVPAKDRRLPLAVFGLGAGGGLGFALVGLIGFLSPRVRSVGDLPKPDPEVGVLGAIPEFDASDPDLCEMAASSVHMLRNLLEVRERGESACSVYTVTSATAAEGKSTSAKALARSFAASGRRTLLVDADLIGRQLTAERDMLDRPGFSELVREDREIEPAMLMNDSRNLWLLASGSGLDADPDHFSPSRVRRAIARLREQYDTIIVDTGPILGSLEASALVGASDAVLVVVARGKDARLIKVAVERLRHLEARFIGLVFNRARKTEITRSVSSMSNGVRSRVGGRSRPSQATVASLVAPENDG